MISRLGRILLVIATVCGALFFTPSHAAFPPAGGEEYKASVWDAGGWSSTKESACAAWVASRNAQFGGEGYTFTMTSSEPACVWDIKQPNGSIGSSGSGYATRSVAASCPANSSLSGGQCVCIAPASQNAANNACEVTDPLEQICKDAKTLHYSTLGQGSSPVIVAGLQDSGFYCKTDIAGAPEGKGCSVEFKADMSGSSDGVNWRTWGSYGMSGKSCASSPDAPPAPLEVPTAMPEVKPEKPICPSPKIPGTASMNGQTVTICSDPIASVTPTEKTVDKKNPGTPAEETTETSKQTSCTANTCKTTTTTVVKNSSSVTTSSSSNESTSGKSAFCEANPNNKNCGADDGGLSDGGLPGQPTLYEAKYPDGLPGVWAARKAELSSTPLANAAGNLMPNVADGGTCPVWNVNMDFGVSWANFGNRNFAPPCYIWAWGKFFIITGALLLARALVFGG